MVKTYTSRYDISEAVQTFKKRFLFLMTEVQVLFLLTSSRIDKAFCFNEQLYIY